MSKEKEAVLKSLGAEVVRTPTEAGWEDEESHIRTCWGGSLFLCLPAWGWSRLMKRCSGLQIEIAKKLAKEIPGAVILDQYNNVQNPLAHYYGTFGEIHVSVLLTLPRVERPTSGRDS